MNIKKLFTTNFYKNNNREYKERIKKDYLINQEFRGKRCIIARFVATNFS